MNKFRRLALRALTIPIDLKKNYKFHRRFIRAAHPCFKPLYQLSDQKIELEGREIPIRIFHPGNKEGNRVLLFFHGGGWVTGNIDSYSHICANMAKQTGHTVISVDYRLAPEHPFPAGLEDCYYAAKVIFGDNNFLQTRVEDITLIGDSAGGNLAAAVSLMARDKGDFKPLRQILLYPVTYHDHSENTIFPSVIENGEGLLMTRKRIQDYMDLYIEKEEDRYNPYASPYLMKDLKEQPKTLIITAQFDLLRDEGEAYGMRLKKAGNTVVIKRMKNALHGFLDSSGKSANIKSCYKMINRFLNEEISNEKP